MDCPKCGVALTERWEGLFDDIPVHVCQACHGAFYPPGSLDRLDDHPWVAVEALDYDAMPDHAARRPCPACWVEGYRGGASTAMEWRSPRAEPSLVVARCPRCLGFWLRAGQLDAIRALALRVD